MHFIYFLGRFHVVILHLPITLILVVAGLHWLNRGRRRPELEPALNILWPATAIAAVGTVILGYMHFAEGGFTGPSAIAHRALGTSVGVISLLGWWLHSHRDRATVRHIESSVVALLVLLIIVTGHFGGNLSHGSDFLVSDAPQWMRHALGLPTTRPPVINLALADPYLDVVRPIFEERCLSCHNADERRGGLDLSRYATLIKGGDDGRVIVPGNSNSSDLIRRVSLSPGDDDFMPKDGKPPLTTDQIAIVRWWIDSGAKTGVEFASLQVPVDVRSLVTAELRLGTGAAAAVPTAEMVAPPIQEIALGAAGSKADARTLNSLVAVGFMARQVSLADAHLIVSPTVPGKQITAAQIQTLTLSAAGQVAELDLRGAGLDDAAVAPVSRLNNLLQLRLDRNKITEKTVKSLQGLTKLRVLGLYGNKDVTDQALATIAQMKSLKKVFLWQTGVTVAAIKKLRVARPDLIVDFGDEDPSSTAPTGQTSIATR